MQMNKCLNCDNELSGKFCSGCGQKADTHRISLKHFFFHDVLHGTFHLEKGMLFTAKEAMVRPGKAALDYIAGKRIRYYNVFYLILITAGLMLFIRHFFDGLMTEEGQNLAKHPVQLNEASKKINELLSQKSKIIIFLFVPFAAINSFILFRRKKLNLGEHAIIAGMILLSMLILSTFGNALFYAGLVIDFTNLVANIVSISIIVLTFIYIIFGYWNAFGNLYTHWGMTYRILLFFGLLFLEIATLFILIAGFVTNWKFGKLTIIPFG